MKYLVISKIAILWAVYNTEGEVGTRSRIMEVGQCGYMAFLLLYAMYKLI